MDKEKKSPIITPEPLEEEFIVRSLVDDKMSVPDLLELLNERNKTKRGYIATTLHSLNAVIASRVRSLRSDVEHSKNARGDITREALPVIEKDLIRAEKTMGIIKRAEGN